MKGIHATLIVVEMRVKNGLKSENPKLGVVCGYSLECGNSCWVLDGGRLELKNFISNPGVGGFLLTKSYCCCSPRIAGGCGILCMVR